MKNIFLLLLLFLAPSVFANVNFNVGLGEKNLSDLIDVKKAQAEKKALRVYYSVDVDIGANVVVEHVKDVWYFATSSEIQSIGQTSIYFNEHTQTLNIIHAATLSPNLQSYTLTVDDTKELSPDTYNAFTSTKELLLTFPKLEVGGFTYLEYEIITDKRKKEADWSFSRPVQANYTTTEFKFSASWQAGSVPNIPFVHSGLQCQESNYSFKCTGQNLPSVVRDENMSWYDEAEYIELGELFGWDSVIKLALNKFDGAYTRTPENLKKILRDNLGESYSQEQAIEFIHQFVARKIRYLSRSEHGHSVTPHNTEDTLDKLLGDCKDKTTLFIDFMRQVGIEAYPVLVSTRRQKVREHQVPSMRKFNHVVACFEFQEDEFCVDGTDTKTHWQNMPTWIQGKYALKLIPNSKPYLLAVDKNRWRMDVSTEIIFDNEGGQKELQRRTYYSGYAAWVKDNARNLSEQDFQDWLVEEYTSVVADSAVPAVQYSGSEDLSAHAVLETSTVFSPFMNVSEELNYTENDAWIVNEVKNNTPSNKFYGEFVAGSYMNSTYTYNLNNIWSISVRPADVNLKHRFGTLKRTSAVDEEGALQVKTTLDIPSVYLTKADVLPFKNFLKILKNQSVIKFYGNKN